MIDVFALIAEAQKRGGSDVLLTVDSPPAVRVRGELEPMQVAPLAPEDTISALGQLAPSWDRENPAFPGCGATPPSSRGLSAWPSACCR